MDGLSIALRIVHILAGVFWVGGAIFLSFFLERTLTALGPSVQGPVMRYLSPRIGPAFTVAGALVIGSGAWLALRIQGASNLAPFLSTGWGVAILLGFIATVVMLSLGLGVNQRIAMRMEALVRQAEQGGGPPPAAELQRLGHRLQRSSLVSTLLGILALGTMAAARFA